jgi:molybdopterin-guanine dinucleotide biosynthesis adapter protein
VAQRIFGFAGWSGSGKTTLIERVIATLAASGKRVSLIKHAHHAFDLDQPGKDSHRHRIAGASEVLVSSGNRFAIVHELRGAPELSLREAVTKLSACDLVLIEGYKRESIPKMEIWRADVEKPLLFPTDRHIIALATDDALPAVIAQPAIKRFGLDDVALIADFALSHAVEM